MRAMHSLAIALLFSIGASVASAADLNTRDRLAKFGNDLVDTWQAYGTEAQKTVRTQVLTDLNSSFTKEVGRAPAPADQKLSQNIKAFLGNLEKANDLFKVEKMKAERSNYIKGCGLVFKREVAFASDFAAYRTSQACFKILMDFIEDARDRFVQERNQDLRAEAYSGAQMLFTALLKSSAVPPNVDHAALLDMNIKEAKQRFPTTVQVLADKNQAAFAIMESAAKQIKQKSTKR